MTTAATPNARMQIPFFRYPHLFNQQRDELLAAVTAVMERGAYILQSDLTEFELSLKQFLGNLEKEFRAWDVAGELPTAVLEELRQFGLFGLVLPEDAGGLGLGNTAYSRTLQELSRYDGSVAAQG